MDQLHMICPTCHGRRAPDLPPCPDCGGSGFVHCCEGECVDLAPQQTITLSGDITIDPRPRLIHSPGAEHGPARVVIDDKAGFLALLAGEEVRCTASNGTLVIVALGNTALDNLEAALAAIATWRD